MALRPFFYISVEFLHVSMAPLARYRQKAKSMASIWKQAHDVKLHGVGTRQTFTDVTLMKSVSVVDFTSGRLVRYGSTCASFKHKF